MTIDVTWIDHGREPQCAPDPKYPNGKPVSLLGSATSPSCTYNLPHPAPRCGAYHVRCRKCGYSALITTAGRPDDPSTVTMPCKVLQ
jgi:hypothetical protein